MRRSKARVNLPKKGGKVSSRAHGIGDSRRMQHVGAEISVRRYECSCRDDLYAQRGQESSSGIHSRSAGSGNIGNGVNHEILHSDKQNRRRGNGGEKRKRNIFTRVTRFSSGDERRL